MCHQRWFWQDEIRPTARQLSEAENVSSMLLLCYLNYRWLGFFQSPVCQYIHVCVFWKPGNANDHYAMFYVVWNKKLLKKPQKQKQPKILNKQRKPHKKPKSTGKPQPQNQPGLYAWSETSLNWLQKFKNGYNPAAMVILVKCYIVSRLETSFVFKKGRKVILATYLSFELDHS